MPSTDTQQGLWLKTITSFVAGATILSAPVMDMQIVEAKTNIPDVYYEENRGRYDSIDIGYLLSAMTVSEYFSFKDFIGEEDLFMDEEDFDVYYPDEEI
jgi:hypothetical protein